MFSWLHFTRRMATIASVSNLGVTPVCSLHARPSASHSTTRCFLSGHTVYGFSTSRSSSFTRSENWLRVRSAGEQDLFLSKVAVYKRKRMTTSATSKPQDGSRQYFALIYDYVPDILEKRGPHRAEHLALAQAQVEEGKALLGGAWGSPVDGAIFIWHVHSADEVQQFVDKDPYVRNGLVTNVDIRPIAAAVGAWMSAKTS